MAQEVEAIMPDAVVRGSDGYLRVFYDRLGLRMQAWEEWVAAGETISGNGGADKDNDVGAPRCAARAAIGYLLLPAWWL